MTQHRFAKMSAVSAHVGKTLAADVRTWQMPLLFLAIAVVAILSVNVPATAQSDSEKKVVEGLSVYLGVMPAEIVHGYPASRPEATMHGGVPRGAHEHHIVIAVFDVATGKRVENANVTATVSGLGHIGQRTLRLDPMKIAGTITYGGFVNFPGNDTYDIAVTINVPTRSTPVHVDFTYKHSM